MGQIESFGNSSTPANELALLLVAELIQGLYPGGMVQKFVLMVEMIDGDDRWLSSYTAPGQKVWDTMGLLQYALAFENTMRRQPLKISHDEDET